MIKIGKISSIDEKKCTAKVVFPDMQNYVSGDMNIIVPFTLKAKAYYMPEIGERVLCITNDNEGFILGSFFAENRLPPDGDKDKAYIDFGDGTVVRYDKKEKLLEIICENGNIKIKGKSVEIVEI